jgi:hypothetical protein
MKNGLIGIGSFLKPVKMLSLKVIIFDEAVSFFARMNGVEVLIGLSNQRFIKARELTCSWVCCWTFMVFLKGSISRRKSVFPHLLKGIIINVVDDVWC